jgi:cobalt-zinc-cadmium efflux system outer membrane protein
MPFKPLCNLPTLARPNRPDILQAQVEQKQANVAGRVAEQNLQASWRLPAAVLRKPDLVTARLEGDLDAIPDLNYEEWVATTLRESPQIKLAEQEVQRAEASVVQARKIPIPDLQMTGLLVPNRESLETTGSPPVCKQGVNGGEQGADRHTAADFQSQPRGVVAAKGEIESARQDLAKLKLHLQRELAGMFRIMTPRA